MTLHAEDEISRCIIFNKAFQSGVHVDAFLFVFGPAKDDGASHESGILRRLAPLDTDVHRIGCNIAVLQNERSTPPPGPKRKYYCGFRTARFGDLPIMGDKYSLVVTLDGENGEPAHVDLALRIDSNDKSERATIKTDAGLAIAEVFGPATACICKGDEGDENHPLSKDPDCLNRAFPVNQSLQFQSE